MTKIVDKKEIAKNKLAERRSYLCQITAQARTMKDERISSSKSIEELNFWGSKPLNYYITNFLYQNDTRTLTFKTFNDWKTEGATIIKGSKAYVIWGQPLKKQKQDNEVAKKEKAGQDDKAKNLDFYPLCFVFSNAQVYFNDDKKENQTQEEQEPETEPTPVMDIDSCL